ncbi:MAG TPA: NADH:flavin oxidoreductase/NADH oxidase [Casimicrobiaceae bacterium]|nr:NADH:flavin oxidoreductase/NADH oxidase [Casimicrobiaceae bacterium]
MSALFQPFALRSLALPNRVVVSPMCQYSARDGCATDWHLVHWGQLLQSGAALTYVEATAVSPEGRISPADLGCYDDASEAALAQGLRRARSVAPPARVVLQLAHAGRKASTAPPWAGGRVAAKDGGWTPVAPSALPFEPDDPAPSALDAAGLARVRSAFADSARRATRAGVDALEVHMAHGYLLNEFLSPLANARDDAYGGSFDNRVRFPLEVFDAVRAAVPEAMPVGVRISATDWVDGGWTVDDSCALALRLKAHGCDFVDVSSAGVSPLQKIDARPGYQVPFARAVRAASGLPTIAVGLITEPAQAEAIVAGGDADLVALARAFLWNPRWVWHAAAALGGQVTPPVQYARAAPRGAAQAFAKH